MTPERRSGQSSIEFLLVVPLVLALLLLTFEFALLYRAKLTLNLATFEATRAAAVGNASFESIQEGFSRSMAALYIDASRFAGPGGTVGAVVGEVTGLEPRAQVVDAGRAAVPWGGGGTTTGNVNGSDSICVVRINPPEEAFGSYGGPANEIPHSNLMYRDEVATTGAGALSIQDANLLQLRVVYCHPMIVPVASTVIRSAMLGLTDSDLLGTPDAATAQAPAGLSAFRRQCLVRGRFPLVSESIMRMQSNAIQDPELSGNCDG